jgi:hypothetical protein
MVIALKTGLSITELIWLYWCEGVIIGGLLILKVSYIHITSVELLKKKHEGGTDLTGTIAPLILAGQSAVHIVLAHWIYCLDPKFDYAHTLSVMGAVIFGQRIFYYFRDSHPWEEPDDLKNVTIESCIYLVRFIPVLALYHYMIKTQAGEGNMTLFTVEFMLFKLASDVIAHFIEGRLVGKQVPQKGVFFL